MILNRLFDPLWLDADVTLRGGGTAVLQKPLHQGDVIAIGLVDLRCVPFAKTVGTNAIVSQVVTDNRQLLLDGPLGYGEDQFVPADAIAKTVIFNVLLYYKGNGKASAFSCFLFDNLQSVTVAIPDNVTKT